MIATLATAQRDLVSLRREVAAITPPPAKVTAVEMVAAVGITLDDWQRDVLESEKRQVLMLASRQSGKSTVELANGSEVHALPGSEETVRGFSGVDLLIEDESARVADDLYMATRPMLAVSGGRIVLLSTPRGKRGHFYLEYTEGGDSWHRATVTAHDCPRIDPAWLAEERSKIGEYWFSQEYLCEFRDTDDQLYSTDLVDSALSADVQPLALPVMQWSAA